LLWQSHQSTHSPPRFYPTRITIPLAPGQAQTLGRVELAANQADPNHLRLRRALDGQWWLANLSESRTAEIVKHGQEEKLRAAPLTAPARIAIAGQVFQLTAISANRLSFSDPLGQHWQFDGVNLQPGPGAPSGASMPPACPQDSWLDWPKTSLKRQWHRLAPYWNRLAPASMASTAALELGGTLACERRLPLAGAQLAPGSVRISLRDGQFVLSSQAESSRMVCLAATDSGACQPGQLLYEHETALAGVSKLVIGRTAYDVSLGADALVLMPRQRVALSTEKIVPNGVQVEFARHDPWQWPLLLPPWALALVFAGATLGLGTWLTLRKNAVPLRRALLSACALTTVAAGLWLLYQARVPLLLALGAGVAWLLTAWALATALLTALIHLKKPALPAAPAFLLVASVLAAMLAWYAASLGTRLGVGWTLLLEALGLLAIALLPQKGGLSFALAGLLFAIGACTQLALGLAGADTGSLRFFQICQGRIACGLLLWFAWLMLAQLWPMAQVHIRVQLLQRAIWLLAMVALLALLAQALWGTEAGVAGFQPVELAKLALIVFSANLLASFMDWNHLRGWARLKLAARLVFLLAVVLLAVVLLLSLVHDFSPLVLLAFWGGGMLLGMSLASGRALGLVLALLLLALALLATLTLSGHLDLPFAQSWRNQALGFDRLAVWLQPALHPHSGAQAKVASGVWQQGGLTGGVVVQPWRLPEVQNDMTPAFFIGRFGALGGALLMLLQSLYLAVLLVWAWRTLVGVESGDFRALWRARLAFFSVWGYAFFLAGHFVVSWGSNLQWLPVMGQPMPFLSSAGSLALFFLMPLQAFLLAPGKSHAAALSAKPS
jgi:cell division protein FtsW